MGKPQATATRTVMERVFKAAQEAQFPVREVIFAPDGTIRVLRESDSPVKKPPAKLKEWE